MSNVFIHPMVLEQDLIPFVELDTGLQARINDKCQLVLVDPSEPTHGEFCGAGEYYSGDVA